MWAKETDKSTNSMGEVGRTLYRSTMSKKTGEKILQYVLTKAASSRQLKLP